MLLLAVFWRMMAFSSNVIWDNSSIYWGGDTSYFSMTQPAQGGGQGGLWSLHLALTISQLDANRYVLTGDNLNLLFSGNWVKPDGINAVANETTTRHLPQSQYLIHQFIDEPPYEGGTFSASSIKVNAGEAFFLMFSVDTDYPNLDVIYGWIQLQMEESGTISYLHSAYDLDGGPMVVGGGAYTDATPEPSAGVLFLLGAAALGLRRKRGSEVCE